MAEALLNKLRIKNVTAFSAGTKLSGPMQTLKELPLAEPVIAVMREEGIDVSDFSRKEITPKMISSSDKIILIASGEIDSNQVSEDLRKNPKVIIWDVPDPKGTDINFHRKVKDMLKERISILVEK